jgi:hypothetical protein
MILNLHLHIPCSMFTLTQNVNKFDHGIYTYIECKSKTIYTHNIGNFIHNPLHICGFEFSNCDFVIVNVECIVDLSILFSVFKKLIIKYLIFPLPHV